MKVTGLPLTSDSSPDRGALILLHFSIPPKDRSRQLLKRGKEASIIFQITDCSIWIRWLQIHEINMGAIKLNLNDLAYLPTVVGRSDWYVLRLEEFSTDKAKLAVSNLVDKHHCSAVKLDLLVDVACSRGDTIVISALLCFFRKVRALNLFVLNKESRTDEASVYFGRVLDSLGNIACLEKLYLCYSRRVACVRVHESFSNNGGMYAWMRSHKALRTLIFAGPRHFSPWEQLRYIPTLKEVEWATPSIIESNELDSIDSLLQQIDHADFMCVKLKKALDCSKLALAFEGSKLRSLRIKLFISDECEGYDTIAISLARNKYMKTLWISVVCMKPQKLVDNTYYSLPILGTLAKAIRSNYSLLHMRAYFQSIGDEVPRSAYEDAAKPYLELNRAGRSYLANDPASVESGFSVLEKVNDNLDALFIHLRENPLLVKVS